jgi:hypothetical protein
MLNGADSDKSLDTLLLGKLSSGLEEAVLVGSLGDVIMSEV